MFTHRMFVKLKGQWAHCFLVALSLCVAGCDKIEFQMWGKPGTVTEGAPPRVFVSTPVVRGGGLPVENRPPADIRVPDKSRHSVTPTDERNVVSHPPEGFSPYQGELSIALNPGSLLDVLSREDFARFRKDKVNQYAQLNIFPAQYDPFSGMHGEIYGLIDFSAQWTDYSKSIVCNPYLLIALHRPAARRSFEEDCRVSEIRYKNGVFEVIYRGEQAIQFFSIVEQGDGMPQVISWWAVNAQDAGFPYVAIDWGQCRNVALVDTVGPSAAIDAVYQLKAVFDPRSFYVRDARYNNLAPAGGTTNTVCVMGSGKYLEWEESSHYIPGDVPARQSVRIKEMRRKTCLALKLWKKKPAGSDDKEDISYIIRIQP